MTSPKRTHSTASMMSSMPFSKKRILGRILMGLVLVMFMAYYNNRDDDNDHSASSLLFSSKSRNTASTLRVFGPTNQHPQQQQQQQHVFFSPQELRKTRLLSLKAYTTDEQRAFLQRYGDECVVPALSSHNNNMKTNQAPSVFLLERFDMLSSYHQVELWKYCMFYTGHGNVYLDYDNMALLQHHGGLTDLLLKGDDSSIAIAMDTTTDNDLSGRLLLHSAFLKLLPPSNKVMASNMIRILLETPLETLQQDVLLLSKSLGDLVHRSSKKDTNSNWILWHSHCQEIASSTTDTKQQEIIHVVDHHRHTTTSSASNSLQSLEERVLQSIRSQQRKKTTTFLDASQRPSIIMAPSCPIPGGYCCQVMTSIIKNGMPILALRHPIMPAMIMSSSNNQNEEEDVLPLPYSLHVNPHDNKEYNGNNMLFHKDQLAYVSTIRLHNVEDQHDSEKNDPPPSTPNFFDILLQNDCLPTTKACHKCLKGTFTKTKQTGGGSCEVCKEACPCYCNVLCKVRPPPKRITKEFLVYPPIYKKAPHRLIPRIIHQTWYEPVTKQKYPNMSRLIESWKQSGWEYNFYDDDMAAEFLSIHFPPEVREAYDSIIPGAFKADLFRYCVLLIRGGVYADMDVLLEANLDEAVAEDIGFMTPIDEPGIKVSHRHCLWNGFLAVAPGHVFLAKTIELVVNNIRNRFTSVDYDDMLCPNPALSVSHTVDMLYTCGPCILGASVNAVLGRHMQDEFEIGDVDLYKSSKNTNNDDDEKEVVVEPDDPRLSIPGRTVILQQNKKDMGAHRFTWVEQSMIVAATDMPDYDDRPPDKEHYSKTHEKVGVYGLKKLYKDDHRANELIRIVVQPRL